MSKKITVDESYLDELLLTIRNHQEDLRLLVRLFQEKNGTVTRKDIEEAVKARGWRQRT